MIMVRNGRTEDDVLNRIGVRGVEGGERGVE